MAQLENENLISKFWDRVIRTKPREIYTNVMKIATNRDLEWLIEEAKKKEKDRILEILEFVEKTKWPDAEHCICLYSAIDRIENPKKYQNN